MFPIICRQCGQRGRVASVPTDLACRVCRSGEHLDLDTRTAANPQNDPRLPMMNLPEGVPVPNQPMAWVDPLAPVSEDLPEGSAPYSQQALGAHRTAAWPQTTEWYVAHEAPETPRGFVDVAGPFNSQADAQAAQPQGDGYSVWAKNSDVDQQGYERFMTSSRTAKRAQIVTSVLASNPGMTRKTAERVARQTMARYPVVAGTDLRRFEDIGYAAYGSDAPRAPSANAEVREALEGRAVGESDTKAIMQAYITGYDRAADEAARGVLREGAKTAAMTKAQVRKRLLAYAWNGTPAEQAAEVECILAQDGWKYIDAVADQFNGAQSGESTDLSGNDFALSALYEAHDGPHLPSCPAAH